MSSMSPLSPCSLLICTLLLLRRYALLISSYCIDFFSTALILICIKHLICCLVESDVFVIILNLSYHYYVSFNQIDIFLIAAMELTISLEIQEGL